MKKLISSFILMSMFFSTVFAQKALSPSFFEKADAFFKKNVDRGLVDYTSLRDDTQLKDLIKVIAQADLSQADKSTKQAFYINAYNINVIDQAVALYPLNSVQSAPRFFDRKVITVAGQQLSLNQLEKEKLLKPYSDARFHFVLVCGAIGCPPITSFAYTPALLSKQLDQQTRIAINNSQFIQLDAVGKRVSISKIFQWYAGDFGGNTKSILRFINEYRAEQIPADYKVDYYEYDWTLNEQGNTSSSDLNPTLGANASRYVVSAAIQKGSIEVKWFNNLYTQRTGSEGNLTDRSTFLTSSLSFLYGLNNRFNIGFDLRYRQVRNDNLPSSALGVLSLGDGPDRRQGITAVGPKIRYAPFEGLSNFSIQSAFLFATGSDLAGSSDRPYIDWNGSTWNTQFFNDFSLGNNFSLFTEVDFLLEDIGSKEDGHLNRFSTPATVILSYFPNPKTTLYALTGFSPYWQSDFDYFAQAGFGAKYQFTPKLELELLYTGFTNKFLSDTGGKAATYNLGLRFNL